MEPRWRTVPKALEAIKEKDPDTSLTLSTIRTLADTGQINVRKSGNRRYVDLNDLERRVQ